MACRSAVEILTETHSPLSLEKSWGRAAFSNPAAKSRGWGLGVGVGRWSGWGEKERKAQKVILYILFLTEIKPRSSSGVITQTSVLPE